MKMYLLQRSEMLQSFYPSAITSIRGWNRIKAYFRTDRSLLPNFGEQQIEAMPGICKSLYPKFDKLDHILPNLCSSRER